MASEHIDKDGETARTPSATMKDDCSATNTWLLCRSGTHSFALPLPHVMETMRLLPMQSLAGAPAMVLGLCVIRGVPVPIVDPATLFDQQPAHCQRLVTVRAGERMIALAVEEVVGVQAILSQALGQLPPLLRDIETVAAIKTLDEELVFFLQAARILPDEFLNACAAAEVVA